MNIKRMVFGESMPDEDDPKYKAKAERCRQAGRNFAKYIKLDKAAERLQLFANNHRKLFLGSVLSLIGMLLFVNMARTVVILSSRTNDTAVERQRNVLKKKIHTRRHGLSVSEERDDNTLDILEYRQFEKNQ